MLLLAAPLNSVIIRSLAAGPRQLMDLQREAGLPAQTTLRAQLKRLVEAGAVGKSRRTCFPGVLEYKLTESGEDLLVVITVLERWLDRSGAGPLELGGRPAKAAIKALVEGWSTTMLRALAGTDLSLTELDRLIGSLSYPSLERRLAAMRLAGLVEACFPEGRATPYSVTAWTREGMAPLFSAGRWEQQHAADAAPITRLDPETAFLLALPPLRVPGQPSGACRMTVELDNEGQEAGVVVTVDAGRVIACTTRLEESADAWVTGATADWLDAMDGDEAQSLKHGGEVDLAHSLLAGLRTAYAEFLTAKST